MPRREAAAFSASQKAFSSETLVLWPEMTTERFAISQGAVGTCWFKSVPPKNWRQRTALRLDDAQELRALLGIELVEKGQGELEKDTLLGGPVDGHLVAILGKRREVRPRRGELAP